MRYLYEAGKANRVMHIEEHNRLGNPTGQALCRIKLTFNRSINAPFALGRKVCQRCERLASPRAD